MNGIIEWFARNHVAANLLMIGVVAAGLLTLPGMRQEVFPEITTDVIKTTVVYPGAAPEEVEEGVSVRIEEALVGVDGIKRVRSTSSEGLSTVAVELYEDADVRTVLDTVKSRIDAIDTLPIVAEKPIVQELVIQHQVLNIAVSGPAGEKSLKSLAQRIRDDLASLPNITHVELSASRDYEVSIEISEVDLERYGLTFDEVVDAVRSHSRDVPGGSIKTSSGEILLRSKGQAYVGEDFARIPIRSMDGWRLTVGDVANVVDGFREADVATRFDGNPSVMVEVHRSGDQNVLGISDSVYEYIEQAQYRMPEGIELTVWQDSSELLRGRRDLLLKNGRDGFILVVIVLALFLKAHVAFWVAIGVPIALLGTLWLLPLWDVSINLLSLFAFIVVLGILVDDAIVTGENIFRHRERDGPTVEASIRGTQEIALPVVFGVATTMAAFAPMLFMPGPFGRIVRVIPAVVLTALAFSIFESKLILPSHLSRGGNGGWFEKNKLFNRWSRIQASIALRMDLFIEHWYAPLLTKALHERFLTLSIAFAMIVVTGAYMASGRMKFTFLPKIEADDVVAVLTMPVGTPIAVTEKFVNHLEEAGRATIAQVDRDYPPSGGGSNARHMLATVGEQPFRTRQSHGPTGGVGGSLGGHAAEVHISLRSSEERAYSAAKLANLWRELAGPIPEASELAFLSQLVSTGDTISIQLRGPNIENLRRAANELREGLGQYPGVYDINDSFRDGKKELKLNIRESADALGLTLDDLGRQVRQAFYGVEIQKIQRGRDELRVMARYPERQRKSLGDVESMRIRMPDGTAVPFHVVADVEMTRGFAAIQRTERQRVINVTAEVDQSKVSANQVIENAKGTLIPRVVADYDGIAFSIEGEHKEQTNTLAKFRKGFLLSSLTIFALLAIPLRSYLQPLVIMSAIPFGFVGAIWGHLIMGLNLSMLSIFGILAAAGVVVNDSLVMVTFINRRRAAGQALMEAVREAGAARFRAIFLTSLTTFLGLTPIMLERSLHARFLIPMAVSLAFGVGFATFVTLLVVPTLTVVVEDFKKLLKAPLFSGK